MTPNPLALQVVLQIIMSPSSSDMSLTLPTPSEFHAFPYSPPYSIQVDLMRHLYTAIEDRKVAIVESPTGTVGHSSMIISSDSG